VGQRGNGAHVPFGVIQDDGVAIGKVIADADNVETAISKPAGVRVLLLVPYYQAHRRQWLSPKTLQEFLNRRFPVQEAIEVARAASLDVVMRSAPYLVKKVSTARG